MFVILAIDGLEYDFVAKHNFKNLMQDKYGKTDLSDFSEPRTIVLWSSILTGKNLEEEVLKQKDLWTYKVKPENTFFAKFKKYKAIDVPGFNYDKKFHDRSRALLKGFFDKKNTVEEYDKAAFEHHRKIKEEFFNALEKNYDILMGYFSLADVVGHLSFGNETKMKMIYQEMDEIVKKIKEKNHKMLVISDHGMKAIGTFGDHSDHGFWSVNFDANLKNPKPMDFYSTLPVAGV